MNRDSPSQAEIIASFTRGIQEMPFPSDFIPGRFQGLVRDEGVAVVKYIGREAFKTMYDAVIAKLSSETAGDVAVVGTIGSGKSHLLAALVVCRRRMRELWPNIIPTIYVPDCELISDEEGLVDYMKSQFQWEGILPTGFSSWNDVRTRLDLKHVVLQYRRMLFVFDNWNVILDEGDPKWHDSIVRMTCGNKRVVGLSARSSVITNHKLANYVQVNLYRGLPWNEFVSWIIGDQYGPGPLRDHWRRLVREEEEAEEERNLAELYDLTGGLPLLMTRLLTYEDVNTLEEAYNLYDIDDSSESFGGAWISAELRRFYINARPDLQQDIYDLWMAACYGRMNMIVIPEIADYRFFKKVKLGETDRHWPICGLVRRLLSSYLRELGWEKFVNSLAIDFAGITNNPSVQEFAYKAYCLNEIARSHYRVTGIGNPTPQINHTFQGRFPTGPSLDLKAGKTSFLVPIKWNLRFIDSCLRHLCTKAAAVFSASSKSHSKTTANEIATKARSQRSSSSAAGGGTAVSDRKQGAIEVVGGRGGGRGVGGVGGGTRGVAKNVVHDSRSARILVVYAIQISLSTPQEHRRSLDFYVPPSLGTQAPAEKYARQTLSEGVVVRHVFVWVTPHDIGVESLPLALEGAIPFEQKHVQIAMPM